MTYGNNTVSLVEKFFSTGEQIHVAKDFVFIDNSEYKPQHIFYLKQGSIVACIYTESGEQVIIHIFQPGSFFPFTSIINTPFDNRYWYVALNNCIVYKQPLKIVEKFISEEPSIPLLMLKNILSAMDKLTLRIEYLITGNASARLKSILRYMMKHFGFKYKKGILIETPFTHSTMASLVGVSRETLTRELNHLELNGHIKQIKKGVFLLDNEFIKELSG